MNTIKLKYFPAKINEVAIFAFLSVYIIWGSTYLAIKYAIETLPPFGMTSIRFLAAGIILHFMGLYKNEAPLTVEEKKVSSLSGMLLIFANAIVCVVEFWVPSGIVAVIVGAMPIWIMFMGWFFFQQGKPTTLRVSGSLVGLFGVGMVTFGGTIPVVSGIGRFGTVFLLSSSLLWATGTLLQRKVQGVQSIFRFSSYQMICGAIPIGIISLVFERPWEIWNSGVSLASLFALLYLILFGSVIGFTAYSWLSRNVEPHLSSTYALVNPIIAVILGTIFFNEPISSKLLVAGLIVLIGLAMIIKKKT